MNVRDTMPMADLKGMTVGKNALAPIGPGGETTIVTRTFEVTRRPDMSPNFSGRQLAMTPEGFDEDEEGEDEATASDGTNLTTTTWRKGW